jgi:curved DNA-binding protein CbpA
VAAYEVLSDPNARFWYDDTLRRDRYRPTPPAKPQRRWQRSARGNLWVKLASGDILTVFKHRGGFKWVTDGVFSKKIFTTEEDARSDAQERFL